MHARRPIDAVLADAATPADVRSQLAAVQRARDFALDLGLEVDGQYTSYVDWPGDRIITSIVATRPGEVEPAGFWFPILGRLPYKGYFDEARAEDQAEKLRAEGLDVCIVGVPAYSTLGWIADPVTAPMLRSGEGRTVETIFHELVHATVFVAGHPEFNETVASFIGQEASIRFYEADAAASAARERRGAVADARLLNAARIGLRTRVEALYANTPAGIERDAARARLEQRARAEIAALPLTRRDADHLSAAIRLNDACLALAGTYGSEMGRYVAALEAMDGDLSAFIRRLRDAADADDPATELLGP